MQRQRSLRELEERLTKLEAERTRKADINRCYRRHKGTGLDVFDVIAAKFDQSTADEARRQLQQHGGKVPWNRTTLGALHVAINTARASMAAIRARGDRQPREPVNGNGWRLADDAERGLTVLTVEALYETKQIKFALRGNGFKRSAIVGWCRARSASAWVAGCSVGRRIEAEARGEHVPGETDREDTAK